MRRKLRTTGDYRLRSAGGFNFGVPPELKYQSDKLPATAIVKIIVTTIIRKAIFAVFLSALYATIATARKTKKKEKATMIPIVELLGAI
ncbi:MAG: hypothetical protein H7070_08225 [Saprospiraceae bacterium]|nr:hypothetical protein [Pyrinomonadaceae bacterium]